MYPTCVLVQTKGEYGWFCERHRDPDSRGREEPRMDGHTPQTQDKCSDSDAPQRACPRCVRAAYTLSRLSRAASARLLPDGRSIIAALDNGPFDMTPIPCMCLAVATPILSNDDTDAYMRASIQRPG